MIKRYVLRAVAALRPLSLVALLMMLVTNAWAQSLSDPLCIESLGPGNLSRTLSFTNGLKNNGAESAFSLEYKYVDADGTVLEDWTPMMFTAASSSPSAAMVKNFDIKKGQKVYVRAASDNATTRGFKIHTATSNLSYWKAKVSGNIMTLLKADGTATEVPEYGFQNFFTSLPLVDASQLQLPATTVGQYGYADMFYSNGNGSFNQGPAAIAATTVGDHACYQMFYGSGFEEAPQMNVTQVAPYCFSEMFSRNKALTVAPELPATELADYCYESMFYNCSSLLAPPALPATTMVPYAYHSMFLGCESMTSAPELPAETLADYCYYDMFYGCKAMKGSITLPATDLVRSCYYGMLRDCSGLESVEVAFTSWANGQSQLTGWLAGTASGCNLICPQALEDALPASRGSNNLPTWMCINGKFPLKVTYDTHPVAYEMKTMAQAMIVPEGIDVFLPALAVGAFGRETATVYPSKPLAAGDIVPANTPFLARAVNPNAPSSGSGTFTFLVTDQPATANATTQGHPAGADYALYGQLTGEGTPTSPGTPYRVWVKRGVNEDPYLEWTYNNQVYSADPGYTCVVTLKENYAANAAAYPNTLVMVFDDVLLEEYKTEQAAYVADNFPQADDCATCTQLIADAKEAIAAVAYSKAETLAENKARVDAIVSKLKSDLWSQRKGELAAYQTAKVAEVEALRLPADRWGAQGLISTAKEDIAAVEFDATPVPDTKTVTYHKELVDAIVTLLTATDLPNQRAFEAEEDRVIAEVVDVKKEADDCDVCTGLINKCKDDILALAYDKAITRDANFARITPLTTQLYADLVTQRTAELNAYKAAQSAAAAALAEAEDAQDCPAIITAAQQAIDAILYTDTQTLKAQKEAVDAILPQLAADLLAERILRFGEYKAVTKANADAKAETGDCDVCTGLIADAKADIDALEYDAEKLFVENKAAQDAIVETMKAALVAQRTSELEAHKAAQSAAAAALAEAEDALNCPVLIGNVQLLIDEITYTDEKTLRAQMDAVDALYDMLPGDLLTERTLRFDEYKDVTKAAAQAKAETGDCDVCAAIISDAQAAIDALEYDAAKLFVENKAAQAAIVETMKADLVAQRTSELEAHKAAQSAAAAALAEAEDAWNCPVLIGNVQLLIDEITYTDEKTLRAQMDAVDALYDMLPGDLLTERTLRFDEYKDVTKAAAQAKAETGDCDVCAAIISNAQAAIDALEYDAEKLFVENKSAQDAIVETMKADLLAQRALDLDTYKAAQAAAADALAETGDSDACADLIGDVKDAIADVTYTADQTVAAQQATVDALLAPLSAALLAQRQTEFAAYTASAKADVAAIGAETDAEAALAVLSAAALAIDETAYNASLTRAENEELIDEIVAQAALDYVAAQMPDITLNDDGLATYSCRYDIEIATEGITAYKAAVRGENIVLTELEGYIPAGTGILLRGETAGTSVSFVQATAVLAADVADNELKATTQADGSLAPLEANSWALSADTQFLSFTGEAYVHNRAYLVHVRPAGARGMRMVFDDEATGIHHAHGDAATPDCKFYQDGHVFILRDGKKYSAEGQLVK